MSQTPRSNLSWLLIPAIHYSVTMKFEWYVFMYFTNKTLKTNILIVRSPNFHIILLLS